MGRARRHSRLGDQDSHPLRDFAGDTVLAAQTDRSVIDLPRRASRAEGLAKREAQKQVEKEQRLSAVAYVKSLPIDQRKAINSRYQMERLTGKTSLSYPRWAAALFAPKSENGHGLSLQRTSTGDRQIDPSHG